MRPLVLSNCEKQLILQSYKDNKRLDGRSCTEYRNTTITLGEEDGSCLVVQGNTKIFAQVSCAITAPSPGRPSEGSMRVNLELSPMAAPHFESGRLGDLGVEVSRLLERTLKQSRCLDLESLCLVAGEKAWEIRIDVHVLDYDGTIVDAASLAALCALRHFRIPEVTLQGDRLHVHSHEEREPVPLYLMHYPLCISFGIYERSTLVVDLTEKEEQVVDGRIVIAMNSHREICAVHCSGNTLFKKEQVLRCSARAVLRAKELTDIINDLFERKAKAKSMKEKGGFSRLIKITGTTQDEQERQPIMAVSGKTIKPEPVSGQSPKIVRKGKVARIQGSNARLPTERDDSDQVQIIQEMSQTTLEAQSDVVSKAEKTSEKKKRRAKTKPDKELQSLLDEIEDDVQVLLPSDSGYKTSSRSDECNVELFDLTGALQRPRRGKEKTKKQS